MVLCLGEPPTRFLLYLHFIFDLHLSIFFIHILLFDIIPHPSVDYRRGFYTPFYTFSPAHRRVIRDTFIFNHSVIFLPRALRFWAGVFYPQAFFTLRSFTDSFDSTCVYQGLPGSRQFFLEVYRASYWSSKHRPSTSVCLIHSNQQKICPDRFYLRVRAARIREETAPREIRTLSTICLAW